MYNLFLTQQNGQKKYQNIHLKTLVRVIAFGERPWCFGGQWWRAGLGQKGRREIFHFFPFCVNVTLYNIQVLPIQIYMHWLITVSVNQNPGKILHFNGTID